MMMYCLGIVVCSFYQGHFGMHSLALMNIAFVPHLSSADTNKRESPECCLYQFQYCILGDGAKCPYICCFFSMVQTLRQQIFILAVCHKKKSNSEIITIKYGQILKIVKKRNYKGNTIWYAVCKMAFHCCIWRLSSLKAVACAFRLTCLSHSTCGRGQTLLRPHVCEKQ